VSFGGKALNGKKKGRWTLDAVESAVNVWCVVWCASIVGMIHWVALWCWSIFGVSFSAKL